MSSNEASRIRRIVSSLRNREDLVEILEMAKVEVVHGLMRRDLTRYDRGTAIYRAAREALGNANVRGQRPRYGHAG